MPGPIGPGRGGLLFYTETMVLGWEIALPDFTFELTEDLCDRLAKIGVLLSKFWGVVTKETENVLCY